MSYDQQKSVRERKFLKRNPANTYSISFHFHFKNGTNLELTTRPPTKSGAQSPRKKYRQSEGGTIDDRQLYSLSSSLSILF